jgi:hypothetical protein
VAAVELREVLVNRVVLAAAVEEVTELVALALQVKVMQAERAILMPPSIQMAQAVEVQVLLVETQHQPYVEAAALVQVPA